MTGLSELGGSAVRSVMERVGRGVSRVQERKPLSYDLLESEDAYLVVFDAAGADHSDIQVRFVDNEVQIRVDRFRSFHEQFEMRFPGRGLALSGRAQLPNDAVDATDATATLTEAGTLQVRIPKSGETTEVPVSEESTDAGSESVEVEESADEPTESHQ
ncbi:MAG: Hsp20 family protein [Halolamina sp.]|uniref:Hsp20/alpha crystallin family protein n=1 Tax=Halolamina sp. TaxID=1940283 RepID=UPI002FC3730C